LFLYAQNRSGVIAVAVTVEIVRIEIPVVPIVVVRCGIEQSRAGIVIGALSGRTDIVDAGVASCAAPANDWFSADEPAAGRALATLKDSEDVFIGAKERFFAAPASLTSLAKLYALHPAATLVAGATDVGLWVTKQLRDLPKVIWLGRVRGFDEIEDRRDALSFQKSCVPPARRIAV